MSLTMSSLASTGQKMGAEASVPTADKYRAGAVARLGAYHVPQPVINRSVQYRPGPTSFDSGAGSVEKLSAFYHHRLPLDVAQISLRAGTLRHDVVTFDTSKRPGGLPLTNQIVAQQYTQVYNFLDTGVRAGVIQTQRHFFQVPAAIDTARLDKLAEALSIETAAKQLDIKLPRLVAGGQGGNNATYSDFEALRGKVVDKAVNDDYGLRLANMARLVLHAYTASEAGLSHTLLGANTSVRVQKKLVAETPLLTAAEFDQGHFIYVGNDVSEEYWAFLSMALLGVQENTGNTQTVYSRMAFMSELRPNDMLTYVLQTGEQVPTPATPAVRVSVLNNPTKCLAFYYAYATSMGLAQAASSLLRQVALMPFMFKKNAVLPYKAVLEPKADAYMYLLRQTREDIRLSYNTLEVIVYQSPIIADAIKAGIAASAFSYRVRSSHRTNEITAAVKSALADYGMALSTLAAILADYGGITADLEWVNPFSESVDIGLDSCIHSYREYGWLLTTYNSLDSIDAFRPAFETGVDMRNAQYGYSINERPYLETLITLSVQGRPWSLESEPLLDAGNPRLQHDARTITHWMAVIQWVRYEAGKGVGIAKITPTPVSPKAPSVEDDDNGELTSSWRPTRARTLSGNKPLPLSLRPSKMAPPTEITTTGDEPSDIGERPATPRPSTAESVQDGGIRLRSGRELSRSPSPSESASTVVQHRDSIWAPKTDHAEESANYSASQRPRAKTPDRGRPATPIGTVVDEPRPRSRTLVDRMKSPLGKQKAHSRGSSVSSKRESAGANTGMMLSRGAQERSELAVVMSASKQAVAKLGESISTSDGRLALIEKAAPSHEIGDIAKDVQPGGLGALDITEWVGSSTDGTKRNVTTLAGTEL
ncbi:P2 protein [Fusarium sacchari chrysovirus 1]|uniref:P2 protein n=1 Tax=Fusarium sacchari chrysovirus 1 TaxID=2716763 RepID=A0A6G9IVA6_9VIRU|nr:P2 protein [Fusarium sacchari chrysovirus 1]